MTDRKALLDSNETPEDVASLYSWANLHGAKYRDFSASRAQARERARLRMQKAIEEEREHARLQAESEQAALQLAAETARAEEQLKAEEQLNKDRQLMAEQAAAQQAAAQAQAAQRAAEQAEAAQRAAEKAEAAQKSAQELLARQNAAREAEQAAQQIRAAQQTAWRQQKSEPIATSAAQSFARESAVPVPPPAYGSPRNSWAGYEAREEVVTPAWLSAARAAQPSAPAASEDSLQGSRDRLASRWFALKSVMQGTQAPVEPAPVRVSSQAPVLAVFSLAGGVGKTSLSATLGRALSARGERVLLVDTTPYGLLPFYFGAQDQRPGQLRTFAAPLSSGDAPVQMITLDPESMEPGQANLDSLTSEIGKCAAGANRILVDLATASGATTRRILRMAPMVIVPVTPDMNSVVSVHAIETFFQRNAGSSAAQIRPFYVLNQFDASLPLHLDVREVLREQLGERLLPITLRRAPAVSEALAEGMTVIDYAPNSAVAEDFANLAGWVKSQSAPASTGYSGVRWSER